jgi:transcriptional regulator with XRE-family HTH domain
MAASDLLRQARHRAGLSQRTLAARASTSQSAVARYEAGDLQPSLPTLERLVAACGLTLEVDLAAPSREVIDDTARLIAEALRDPAEGEPTARRLVLDLLDRLNSATDGVMMAMVAGRPRGTGDPRFDAYLAALTEHLCVGRDLVPPPWVHDPDRFLRRWWFMSGFKSLHAAALVESPISFARRGVFITDGALKRV